MLLKYGYYRFRYYPVIDDWIQYGVYPLYDNIFKDVILRIPTYTTRPLASLSDPYIWGRFWGNMGISFFVITVLHFMSGYLLYKVFNRSGLSVGTTFLVIFLLLPLGSEATYWISASSRLVVGTFFMTLALYFLSLYLHGAFTSGSEFRNLNIFNKNKTYLLAFAIAHLISFGYYEQVIVLSFISALLMIAAYWPTLKKKWIISIPLINFLIIGAYYKFFGNTGNFAARGQFVKKDYMEHFDLVSDKITDVWGRAHLPLYSNGLKRGLELLINHHSYIYIILILLFSILIGLLTYIHKPNHGVKLNCIQIALGFIVFWAPFGPNFLLENVWISNRNAFTSFIGLGLMAEGMINIVFRGRFLTYLKSFCVFAATFIFLIVNVSEITDYKNVSITDRKIVTNVLAAVENTDFLEGRKKAIVFNTRPVYVEQNMYFHEHIHNVTESDWAFTGAARAIAQNPKIDYIKPVQQWHPTTIEDDVWSKYMILGIDDNMEVFPLKAVKKGNGDIKLTTLFGEYFGIVEQKNEGLYMFTK